MTKTTYWIGELGQGAGWSGVTRAEKDRAAGRNPGDISAQARLLTAAENTEDVADAHGSKHWTRRGGDGGCG